MSDLNLPPLVASHTIPNTLHAASYFANSVYARERILLARIAELEALLGESRKATAEVQLERDKWFQCHVAVRKGMDTVSAKLREMHRTNRRLSEEKRRLQEARTREAPP